MSYSISISGSKAVDNDEAAEQFEAEVADKAAEFVATLEGVTSAAFYGGRVNRNLLEAQQQSPTGAQDDEQPDGN